ncbi:MAG: Pyruvate dehydrogenase E1 component [Alphaproteobacteria bacterium MarineAlpha1_Bin1]|nr:MAG: Pyruvate dehydrogenase E1 component [Alphaproteobacteria bacterium MarineAlpha1_Bin1]
MNESVSSKIEPLPQSRELVLLRALERKVLWLSSWMIHNANHLRPNRDGLKVGGHQASSASLTTLMTALYFNILKPSDRVAVKPHASPVFHAIQYLLGRQSREKLMKFRALGGAQSYPSRTKDMDEVDFSTGSVGLGVAMTAFAALVQDYVSLKDWGNDDISTGRMVALMGDAELDEGNVFEAMLEGWKHDVRNAWWIVDYNRQSLDSVITDRLFGRVDDIFRTTGWRVITLKYGTKLQAVFETADGDALRQWIDDCPNSLYSALTYKGGPGWREHLRKDLGDVPGLRPMIEDYEDQELHDLMTNLAGHDMASVLDCFHNIEGDDPTCFIAYTVKGKELPLAGHKDNHAGLMSLEQMAKFQVRMGIAEGDEWNPFAGLDVDAQELQVFLNQVPFAQGPDRRRHAAKVTVPESLPCPKSDKPVSTQEAFGRILFDIAGQDNDFAHRIVTTSPDVTVSTNLGGWVNRRGIFDRHRREDIFREEKVVSAQRWAMHPDGQHVELGIAENNLFLTLAALGLSHSLFGERLLPVGTLYDPFVNRGLDALNYACYQDARFMLIGTPSGITLAPEGGAHQSIGTPLIGLAQDGLSAFEPTFVDELTEIMQWGFGHMQADSGGSVYLRLTTRALTQPLRQMTSQLRQQILAGGYWLRPPADNSELAIVCCGAVTAEAMAAHDEILEDIPGSGLLVLTSPDLAYQDWNHAWKQRASGKYDARSHIGRLLDPLTPDAALVTVVDGHPATLSWLGAASRRRVYSLGVEKFGQSGDIEDLYRLHGIDRDAILNACAAACLNK